MNEMYKIIEGLCKEKSINITIMCRESGANRGSLTDLKKGRTKKLSPDNLAKIASYFDTTVDYLIGKTDIKKLPRGIYPAEELGDFITMPVLASVKAGYDGLAVVEYSDEVISFPKFFFKGYPIEECAVLRVSGDSMYPKYEDGDTIFVHMRSSVDSGSEAVIIYNGDEATVKTVRYISGEDWVELIPRNPEYKTKRIEGPELEDCHVFGLVIGMYRQ